MHWRAARCDDICICARVRGRPSQVVAAFEEIIQKAYDYSRADNSDDFDRCGRGGGAEAAAEAVGLAALMHSRAGLAARRPSPFAGALAGGVAVGLICRRLTKRGGRSSEASSSFGGGLFFFRRARPVLRMREVDMTATA